MTLSNEKVGGRWRAAPTGISSKSDKQRISSKGFSFKENARPAAVFDESDPRAYSAARVVPATARKVMVGGATFGYLKSDRSSMDRSSWRYVVARQRCNELARLALYRLENGLDLGPPVAWALVLANLAVCLGQASDVTAIAALCRRLQLPQLDEDISAAACHNAGTELMKAAHAGALLQVTTVERDDCRLLRIDAWDESADDRQRRLARERQRRRRSVTVTIERRLCARDTVRKSGAGLRRFASRLAKGRSSTALPSRQEPRRFPFFPEKEKGQERTTVETTGVADAHQGSKLEIAKNHSGKNELRLNLDLRTLASPIPGAAPNFGESASTSIIPQPAASPPGEGSPKPELPWTIQPQPREKQHERF